MNASNPTDVMLPIIITSTIGTISALILVGIKQKVRLLRLGIVLPLIVLLSIIGGLFGFLLQLSEPVRNHWTGNLGVGVFLFITGIILAYGFFKEKLFSSMQTNLYACFVEGSKEGWQTALRILPFMISMMAAISLLRNSGLMEPIVEGLSGLLRLIHVPDSVTQAIPVALLRPFSAGGARGFMFDAMRTFGPDSLTGRLACLFEGAAETTFYVIAMYFGSINVKDTRYTLSIMLLVDLICIVTGAIVCVAFFG
jgi:spore maturation protein SpmB